MEYSRLAKQLLRINHFSKFKAFNQPHTNYILIREYIDIYVGNLYKVSTNVDEDGKFDVKLITLQSLKDEKRMYELETPTSKYLEGINKELIRFESQERVTQNIDKVRTLIEENTPLIREEGSQKFFKIQFAAGLEIICTNFKEFIAELYKH